MYTVMVPFDSFDTAMIGADVRALNEIYPKRPDWWTPELFPAVVPYPTPPVLFYYHTYWVNAQTEQEMAFWKLTCELEHALLYAACWWQGASRYGRAVALNEDTIDWMEIRLGNVEIDPEGPSSDHLHARAPVTFEYVAKRMYDAARVDNPFRSRVRFAPPLHQYLSDSYFVPCQKFVGRIFDNLSPGRLYERGMNGNMK